VGYFDKIVIILCQITPGFAIHICENLIKSSTKPATTLRTQHTIVLNVDVVVEIADVNVFVRLSRLYDNLQTLINDSVD
jgi:hypothetical protein